MIHSKRQTLTGRAHRPIDAAEGFAIGGAILCLVHCLFLPVLLAWMPMVGTMVDPRFDFHLWTVILVGPLSAWLLLSMIHHRRKLLLTLGFAGLALLILALLMPLSEGQEVIMSVCGSILLASAHLFNWRFRHESRRIMS